MEPIELLQEVNLCAGGSLDRIETLQPCREPEFLEITSHKLVGFPPPFWISTTNFFFLKKNFTYLGVSDKGHTPCFRWHNFCNSEFQGLGRNRTYV